MIDDAELVRCYCRDGSQDAFCELVRRHIDVVYSAARSRLGNDAYLSADVVQQVFIDLARKASSLSIRSSLVGWLFVRARYIAADRVRAERQRRKREQAASIMNEPSSSEFPPDEWRQLRPLLDEALGQLGAADRELVLLRYFEHRTVAEISALLQLSEGAAQKRLERALDRLRMRLGSRGVTSTAAALGLLLSQQVAVAAPAGMAETTSGAALASLGTIPVGGAAAGALMASTKFTIAAALAVLAGTAATWEYVGARHASTALAMAEHSYAARKAQLAAVEAKMASAASHRTAASTPVSGPSGRSATLAASRNAAEQLAATDPAIKRAADRYFAARVESNYGPLLASLHLSPDQAAQLRKLLSGTDQIGLIFHGQPLVFGGGPENREGLFATIQNSVGDDAAQAVQEYERTGFARGFATEVSAASSTLGSPLSADQITSLTTLISALIPTDGTFNPESPELNWDAALAQAGTLLSPQQSAALAGIVRQVRVNVTLRSLR